MSALDDVLGRMKGLDDDDGESTDEARAELELLRNMAEEFCVLLKDRIIQGPDSWEDWVDTYLYIYPERARGRWG